MANEVNKAIQQHGFTKDQAKSIKRNATILKVHGGIPYGDAATMIINAHLQVRAEKAEG